MEFEDIRNEVESKAEAVKEPVTQEEPSPQQESSDAKVYVPFNASSMGNYRYEAYNNQNGYSYTPNASYAQNKTAPSPDAENFYEILQKKRSIKRLGNAIGMPLSVFYLGGSVIS